MNAVVLHNINDLRYEKVPVPDINSKEVLIKVKAAGICSSDVIRVKVKGAYKFPIILGHEIAGEVFKKGDDVDKVKPGDRVVVIPLVPCRKCSYCQIGEYAQCDDYDYLGSRSDGGFAEYVKVKKDNLVLIPEGLSYKEAVLTEPASVALHAIRRAGVDVGDSVAIFGSGTIGIILAQWASIMGAKKIFLVDVVPEKLKIAESIIQGNSHTPVPVRVNTLVCGINASSITDPVKEILKNTNNSGVDISLESAGQAVTFEQCIRSVRKLGKVVFLGNINSSVNLPQETVSLILRKQVVMYGSWNSSFSCLPKNEWETTLDFVKDGKLKIKPLISREYKLKEANKAFDMMFNQKEIFQKVIFIFN